MAVWAVFRMWRAVTAKALGLYKVSCNKVMHQHVCLQPG